MGSGAVTGGLSGGGANLGVAHGTIVIDTAELSRAVQAARAAGRQIEAALGNVDRGTARADQGIKTVNVGLRELGGTLGVVFGIQAIQQIGRFVLASDAMATSYRRQSVAALSLAGGQSQLNELLSAYERATGGVLGKAQSLADVTSLQAIGFADSAQELDRFVRAARGISLAKGQTLDYTISQLQLAIANQSELRLDQLGIDLNELNPKLKQLQAENVGLTQAMVYQNAILEIAEKKFGALSRSAEANATGAEKVRKAWADFSLTVGESFGPATSTILTGLAGQIENVSRTLRGATQDAQAFGQAFNAATSGGSGGSGDWLYDILMYDPITEWATTHGFRFQNGSLEFVNIPGFNSPGAISGGSIGGRGSGRAAAPVDTDLLDRQRQERVDFAQQLADIDQQANQDRLDTTRQYESQRTQTITDYERTIARDAEDFARQRARAEAQFARQVVEIGENATSREANWFADLQDRLAELRADSADRQEDAQADTNQRIAEINEDYQRSRENAERDHKDRLISAAARLDAQAVFEEQRRFDRESQDAERAHNEQVDDAQEALARRLQDEQENLAERVQQEQEAHQERLQEAREADAERLADMTAAFEEQKRLEDEDRVLRLERMAEDHAAQLAQQAAAQQERLLQIGEHAAQERELAEAAHIRAMEVLGIILSEGYKAIADASEAALLKTYDHFVEELNKRFAIIGAMTQAQAGGQWDQVNLGDPSTWGTGGRFGAGSAPTTATTRSFVVAPGAIQIISASGNPTNIAQIVRDEFTKLLRELTH